MFCPFWIMSDIFDVLFTICNPDTSNVGKGVDVFFFHVRGHVGHIYNGIADQGCEKKLRLNGTLEKYEDEIRLKANGEHGHHALQFHDDVLPTG